MGVATKIAMTQQTKKRVNTIVFRENYRKTKKLRQGLLKQNFGFRSRVCVGKELAPYNDHPKMIPIIECSKIYVVSKYLIFPKNKKTLFKFFFWVRLGCTSLYISPFIMEYQGYLIFYKNLIEK